MEKLLIVSYNNYDDCYLFKEKSDGNITIRVYRIVYDEYSCSYDIENNGNLTYPSNYYKNDNKISKLYTIAKNVMISTDYTRSFVLERLKISIRNEYSPVCVYKNRFTKCGDEEKDIYIALDTDDIEYMMSISG